jgi:excisionase family DNA binding protein
MIDEDTVAPLERMAYSVSEAAKVCGLSTFTLYKNAREGKIQFKKVGGRTFVTREELLRFVTEAPNYR